MKQHKKNLASSQSLGAFPIPSQAAARSYYQDSSNKGWCSERVPPHPSSSATTRQLGVTGLTPFYSGRAVPSKWEDAERWVCSPVMGYGPGSEPQSQFQKRPKSKSGPIVAPGVVHYSNCSPALQVLDAGPLRNLVVNSPFSTGVLMPNGVGLHYGAGGGRNLGGGGSGGRGNSSKLVVWSDLVSDSSLPSSPGVHFVDPDGRVDEDMINEENTVSRVVSRRDMATQMSPDSKSNHSSPRRSSTVAMVDSGSREHPSKMEIREVQVDKKATVTSWSTKHSSSSIVKKRLPHPEDFHQNAMALTNSCSWDITEAVSDFSKVQREEAKITAWENLQKAKAEAEMRKLEMKLERKRSSSMDKILTKLTTAQLKAQQMRSSMPSVQEQQIPKRSQKSKSTYRHKRFGSMRSCFNCHAL
ncbi:unnamed protein product [Linum tenue]|uniref:Remorin C-terminal domain-containing protein n=1 Tax=Linum tenue TaxID=586396 RepID=A0AAV0L797_9ROSI|nr:unnamed protein product [Linum tenue]